ncbi:hypothetical protein [Bacillus alkalicellulosilyticus]|uniref:hypothetical protein n=1 Tax=Alkalihalobacterium alkalicellulosilyticum TaxID=1912214 RepID=UPI000998E73A|nr:hypothetical protein [Bacillus alkalicellulosilyticus]
MATNQSEGNKDRKHNFCVISSRGYVVKVLALYQSLKKHSQHYFLWICCTDDMTYNLLSKINMEFVKLIKVNEIEDKRLLAVKKERKINEYCWTLKAPFIKHVLTTYNLKSVIYLDGDLFFFSDPSILFEDWGEDSIYLCPQRDLHWVENKYGKYQAGLIGFKNDKYGLQSVTWWHRRCLEYCGDIEKDGKFGDQKYLDQIPEKYPYVKVSSNAGVDAAPWNCVYNNQFKVTKKKDRVFIESDRLIVFHFACLSILNKDEFDLWSLHKLAIDKIILNEIYHPYLKTLREGITTISKIKNINLSLFLSEVDGSQVKTYYSLSSQSASHNEKY